VKGFPEAEAERLVAVVPKTRSCVDVREAGLEDVARTMETIRPYTKYYTLYRVVLDGGIRLVHAVQLLQSFKPERLTRLEGFTRYSLGLEKEVKHTWYAYMRLSTADMLKNAVKITKVGVFRFIGKKKPEKIVTPKLIRKFAFNMMIKTGMPESVADFICGRKPVTVGARHYLWVRDQADQWYPRYAEYLDRVFGP
jgi:intergrase/recombinase